MVRTQIYLEEKQVDALRRLAAQTGRRQSTLIREAIDRLLVERPSMDDWRAMLDETAGAWADRDDLDDLVADSRRSADERLERLWR
jgi:hypothetical protein